MSNIDYTLWPNANGNLGEIKVQIPDGITTTWPEGDVLVGNFVYNKGKLAGFVDTKALIANESKSTTFPYDYVNIQVDKSLEGLMTFNQGERTKYFTVTYTTSPNVDGGTFDYVIIDFNTTDQETIDAVRTAYRVVDKKMYAEDGSMIGTWDTSKIEVGGFLDEENGAFDGLYCNVDVNTGEERGIILAEFDSDLSSLTDGTSMFVSCSNLIIFNADLSSLTNGYGMFGYCSFTSFTSDLSSLTNGMVMFIACSNLTTFTSDLSSLTNGYGMFMYCENLESFTSDLSSLTNGYQMFNGCKLDSASVSNILNTINTVEYAKITLGIGCEDVEQDAFANEIGAEQFASILRDFQAKGWVVEVQYNGRPTTTYGLRRTTEPTLPVFVKLEEVEETNDKFKSFYTHISLDGSKKFRLTWFHETTGSTDGYTQYASIEEAIEALNIKPIERNTIA